MSVEGRQVVPGSRRRRLGVSSLIASLLLLPIPSPVAAVALDPHCSGPDASSVVICGFVYTGAAQTWTIPSGAINGTFEVYGAAGDHPATRSFAGKGASSTATVPLNADAGKTLTLIVAGMGNGQSGGFGGGGDGGRNGSGGGGASSVSYLPAGGDEADRLYYFVAGGGGGAGGSTERSEIQGGGGDAGHDGNNGVASDLASAGLGGGAGLASGAGAGGDRGVPFRGACFGSEGGGSAGGGGGAFQGGAGGNADLANAGGGGGGGINGGGGGGAGWSCLNGFDASGGGGGGGGSSFVVEGGMIFEQSHSGNGHIVIKYTTDAPIDTTAPVLTPHVTGTLGDNGWYTTDLRITFSISDPESTFGTTCGNETISFDVADVEISCSAESTGGTSTYDEHFKIDTTAPSLAPTISPNPVAIGGSATALPNATDAMSGVATASCQSPQTATGGVKSLTCAAKDNAGNSTLVPVSYTVSDPTAPDITPRITGTEGDNGWFRSAVSITWEVSDPESTFTTSGCDPVTLTNDTALTQVTCSAFNGTLNNQATLFISIDQSPPTLAPTVTPNPVEAGQTATAEPHASDALSGIASSSCPTPNTTTAAGRTLTCTARDNAGNTASKSVVYVVTDPSSPVITPHVSGTVGDNGWFTSAVSISFTITDPQSSFTTDCADQTLTADTADVHVSCRATSAGGSSLFSAHFKIDRTAPTLTPSVVPNPVSFGQSATATPNASDALSGLASSSCQVPDTTSVGAKTLSCTAKDNAGNVGSRSVTYSVTDPTPPVIIPHVTGTPGVGGDPGWFVSAVSITFTVTDPESAITASTCSDRTLTAEGTNVTTSCTATSAGGTSTFSQHFAIDRTAPSLSPTVTPNPVAMGGTATVNPNASDATSGVLFADCQSPLTATVGVKTLNCTAKDKAGNTATRSATYTVGYRFLGFQRPAPERIGGQLQPPTFKAGSSIQVVFSLSSASGTLLSDAQGAALASACSVRVAFTGGTVSPDCATYDPTSDAFQFALKTPKGITGKQTITVRVYAGTDVVTTATIEVMLKL